LRREEETFSRTLKAGMTLLGDEVAHAKKVGTTVFPGATAFKLHDTHGFPIELTAEVLEEQGIAVDREGFDAEMTQQRERARAAAKVKSVGDEAAHRAIFDESGPTNFLGREIARYTLETSVLGVLALDDGRTEVFLHSTPFYAESGGQVGDTGVIVTESGRLVVSDTQSVAGGLVSHRGHLTGEIVIGQTAVATIDGDRREAVRRNHTATHLLHAALRSILGDHVRQQGSLVAPDRLRFDFAHTKGVAREEFDAILEMVNRDVVHNDDVETIDATKQEAEQMGAVAFFGDKYGDRVRVVRAGSHSLEFCGGTHVRRLGDIGQIQVVSEASIGSGTRRIEAISGGESVRRSRELETVLSAVATTLKVSIDDVVPALDRVIERQRESEKALSALRQASLTTLANELRGNKETDSIVARVDGYEVDELRTVAQNIRSHGVRCVVLAGLSPEMKVALVVATSGEPDAKVVVKELGSLIGGGGGGSSELATAGGKNAAGVDSALHRATELLG
jgi:alanyl-tRNA synthetase